MRLHDVIIPGVKAPGTGAFGSAASLASVPQLSHSRVSPFLFQTLHFDAVEYKIILKKRKNGLGKDWLLPSGRAENQPAAWLIDKAAAQAARAPGWDLWALGAPAPLPDAWLRVFVPCLLCLCKYKQRTVVETWVIFIPRSQIRRNMCFFRQCV